MGRLIVFYILSNYALAANHCSENRRLEGHGMLDEEECGLVITSKLAIVAVTVARCIVDYGCIRLQLSGEITLIM